MYVIKPTPRKDMLLEEKADILFERGVGDGTQDGFRSGGIERNRRTGPCPDEGPGYGLGSGRGGGKYNPDPGLILDYSP